ncbi:A/G-specific adenine glycosylase [Paenibacillus sp. FSL H8-0457]|uniref:A/G-specific adenine glycosylase n=1 Tax=Bacillales TaxID=1385 RepID=UPI0003E1D721|nr:MULTISPECIES: A/G-specific adenine glycosylase [Paenibacillus]ETT60403.1 A/G-specific adenine glycosylase [Paenibacillus sp. FSL H8-457]MCM3261764.1 A/G-specific adenine glycosylase [Paenibacillus lautus]
MHNTEHKRYFSQELLDWYEINKRDLPWRRHRDPYYIWVSEIMLQQTRVDTVIPYFHRFIERFPTIQSLADAPEDDVLKCWEGLGYYSRARNLQAAARQVTEQYDGVMPSGKDEVSGLKGIGPYTSGAIRSIAFNIPAAAVDGNVMRVLSRYFLIEEDIMKVKTRTKMEDLVLTLVPDGRASDFTQALMELGALICTPKSPKCLVCPVMEHCSARLEGKEESLPIKTKAKPPRPEYRLTAIVEGTGVHEGKILIRKRPAAGLLAGMWELPHVIVPADGSSVPAAMPEETAMVRLRDALLEEGVPVQPIGHVMDAEHTFSHIQWNMGVYRCKWQDVPPAALQAAESAAAYETGEENFRWIHVQDMERYAFPNVFIRILNAYFSS